VFGVPVGPGVASSEGHWPPRGRAARAVAPIGLALAGLGGLLALATSRRKQAARAASDLGRPGTGGPEGKGSSGAKVPSGENGSAEGEASLAGGPTRSGWWGAAVLAVVAVLCAALSVLGYNWLSHRYWPVVLTVTTSSQSNGQQIALTGNGEPTVRWGVSGYVGQLTVVGPPGGSAEIMLPVPVTQCAKVLARLRVACGAGGLLTLPSPTEFSWSTAQELYGQGGLQTASELDLEPSTGAHGAQSVTIAMTDAHPVLCLSPTGQAKLTIATGGHSYTAAFTRFTACDGIAVVIGSAGGTPPVLELGGIDGAKLTGSAPAGTLQDFTGQVMLTPGGTSVPGSATPVSLEAAGHGLSASLDVKPGSQTLSVTAHAATSVTTADGQLVPSEWSREAVVFGPLLGAFVTAFVVAPLGVSVGVLTAALKRWRGPRWPRWLRKKAGGRKKEDPGEH
jgi:hypothetical protein